MQARTRIIESAFCPRCPGNDWVRRKRVCWYDSFLLLLGLCPYECLICFRRFYASRRTRPRDIHPSNQRNPLD